MDDLLCEGDTLDLQGMACHRVAQQIFHSYVRRSNCSEIPDYQQSHHDILISRFGLNYDYRKDLDNDVECLMVPQSIKKQIKSAFTCVLNEIVNWYLELSDIMKVNVDDLNHTIWSTTGKIDYKQNAMKILSTAGIKLSDGQKFAIMCEFCLIDELARIDFHIKRKYCTNRLFEYWYWYIKNDFRRMSRNTYPPNRISLNAEMVIFCLKRPNFQRWSAFEYFWHRMDITEQFDIARQLVFNTTHKFYHICIRYPDRILSMVSYEQQRRLLSSHCVRIEMVMRRADSSKSVRWALLTVEIFTSVVKHVMSHKRNSDEWMIWLADLWDSAPVQFRIFAAERIDLQSYMYHQFCNNVIWQCLCTPNIRVRYSRFAFHVCCRIIPLQSGEMKEDGILKLARWLGTKIDHGYLDELLKTYEPSTRDQSTWLTKFSNMKNVCLKLMRLMKPCAVNANSFCYELSKWNALKEFVEFMYPGNGAIALEKKKEFITSCVLSFPHSKNSLTKLKKIVESEIPKDDVNNLKRSLLRSFQEMLMFNCDCSWNEPIRNDKKSAKNYRRFVNWCVGDGARTECGAFVDTIFEEVMRVLNEFYKRPLPSHTQLDESLLFNLQECMLLFLITKEEVEKYKLDKVTSFDDFEIVQSISMQNDELSKETLLNWFFNDDQSAIRKFKSKKLKTM